MILPGIQFKISSGIFLEMPLEYSADTLQIKNYFRDFLRDCAKIYFRDFSPNPLWILQGFILSGFSVGISDEILSVFHSI